MSFPVIYASYFRYFKLILEKSKDVIHPSRIEEYYPVQGLGKQQVAGSKCQRLYEMVKVIRHDMCR